MDVPGAGRDVGAPYNPICTGYLLGFLIMWSAIAPSSSTPSCLVTTSVPSPELSTFKPSASVIPPPTTLATHTCGCRRGPSWWRYMRRRERYTGVNSASACSRLLLEAHSGPIRRGILEGHRQLASECSHLLRDEPVFSASVK